MRHGVLVSSNRGSIVKLKTDTFDGHAREQIVPGMAYLVRDVIPHIKQIHSAFKVCVLRMTYFRTHSHPAQVVPVHIPPTESKHVSSTPAVTSIIIRVDTHICKLRDKVVKYRVV